MSHARRFDGMKLGLLRDAKKFILLLLVFFLIFQYVIGFSRVSGNSMEPNFHSGEWVLYLRFLRTPAVGDIVSVRVPSGDYFIKRVVATGGDRVDIREGTLYVNDRPDPYGQTQPGSLRYPCTIPQGQFFVLGDNRAVSQDSRDFGPVSAGQLKGTVLLTFSRDNLLRLWK